MEIDVYGQRLILQGGSDELYVQSLAQYVEGQMKTVANGVATSTSTKVAILAAINITHQLFQQEKRRQAEEADVDRRTTQLLDAIEGQLHFQDDVA